MVISINRRTSVQQATISALRAASADVRLALTSALSRSSREVMSRALPLASGDSMARQMKSIFWSEVQLPLGRPCRREGGGGPGVVQ